MFCTFKPRTSMLAGFWVSISVPLLPKWQATIPSSSSLNSCTGKLSRAVLWTGVALQALTPVVQMLPGFGPEWAALPWPSPVPWKAHSTAWVGPKKQPALHYCSPPRWQGRWGWHQGRWSSPRSWSMGQAGCGNTPQRQPQDWGASHIHSRAHEHTSGFSIIMRHGTTLVWLKMLLDPHIC